MTIKANSIVRAVYDCEKAAARNADRMAEIYAENAREDDAKFQAEIQIDVRADRMAKNQDFSASIKSTGLELIACTRDREKALALFKSFPRELIIGGLFAARGIYGEFFIVADVGAIPAANLWPLIKSLYGFSDESELAAAEKVYSDEQAARRADFEKACAEREAKAAAALAGKLATMADRPKGKPLFPGEFLICRDTGGNGPQIVRYKTERGSFGRWFYRCTLDGKPFDATKKAAVVPDTLRARWETYAAAGQVFAV